MPLYVRDEEANKLATELKRLTNAPTKTHAVIKALREAIERSENELPVRQKLKRAIAMAQTIGDEADPNFDMKKFTDDMWSV